MIPLLPLAVALLCASGNSRDQEVLLLHSYHPEYEWTQGITGGVRDSLAQVLEPEQLRIEYMDARRHMDDARLESISFDFLERKYGSQDLDLILLSDEPAFEFWLAHGSKLAAGVPVVFGGVNVLEADKLQDRPEVTGVAESMEIARNVELIAKLQPELRRIVFLGDQTRLGQKMVQRVESKRQELSKLARGAKLEVWDHFADFDNLYARSESLGLSDAILVLAVHSDDAGHYWSYAKHLPKLTQHSGAPVYAMWGVTLGKGVVGGYMNSAWDHGEEMGGLAAKILGGQAPDSVPIVPKTRYTPRFDERALLRYGIDLARLPEHAELLHQTSPQQEPHIDNRIWWLLCGVGLVLVGLHWGRSFRARALLRQSRVDKLDRQNRELVRNSTMFRNLALTDDLTGVANRRAGIVRLDALCEVAQQGGGVGEDYGLVIADIDHFKQINDTLGHEAGDKVLQAVAHTLQEQTRPGDGLYRWGGEEFVLVVRELGQEALVGIVERIREAVASTPIAVGQARVSVTMSFGAVRLGGPDNWRHGLERADQALYLAKSRGRNRVEMAKDGQGCEPVLAMAS